MDKRICARAILINPESHILLLKTNPDVYDPSGKIESPYWIAPGGGVEANETLAEAVAREIFEECGITNLNVGPKVWYWNHILEIAGKSMQLQDHFFLIRTEDSRVSIDRMNPQEYEDLLEYKWWRVKEIQSSDEIFAPPGLGQLLEELFTIGSDEMQVVNIP